MDNNKWIVVELADEYAVKEEVWHKRGFSDRIATVGMGIEGSKEIATLLAAAPDMLAALKAILDAPVGNTPERQAIRYAALNQVSEAIKKATA